MAFLFGQEGEGGKEKISISEQDRPKCLYTLRFTFQAYEKLSEDEVIKRVTNYVESRLREFSSSIYQGGKVDVSDFNIYVGITSYTVTEVGGVGHVLTFADGIITISLSSPFGQYALIAALREGY